MFVTVLIFGAMWSAAPSFAAPPESRDEDARKVAESWLVLVDAGPYGESWEAAASFFKGRISKQEWQTLVGKVRGDFGGLQSREFTSSKYTKELPGAPDGDYVVIQFRAAYAKKKSSIETVTPMIDVDGQWRVSGYRIQ